ncbi:MAG TPA: hypothetical protein VM656_16620 [Pyrinomonadaceae bacterium]|nr:hypothetical protein [Pyrinomonadaceae bacterium]
MRRTILRLATALLTFCLGVVVTVISSVKRTETPVPPTVEVTLQLPFTLDSSERELPRAMSLRA